MNKLPSLLTALLFLFTAYCVNGQVSRVDQESVFFKDSLDQPYATIQSNLIIKLSPEEFTRVDTIHIVGVNQLDKSFVKHAATIDPRTGFIIEDPATRAIIKEYLLKDLAFETVEARIRKFYGIPDMQVHPLVFADPDQSTYMIKMFDRNSGDVSFKYDVKIDYKNGESKDVNKGDNSTISKPFSLSEKTPIR